MNLKEQGECVMTDSNISQRFEFVQVLVRQAGDLALDYFNRLQTLTIKSKGLQDMASEADVDVEAMIRERIAASYPDDAFLGEESGRSDVEGRAGIWVVDPIDGTQPFISGMSGWCVSIAFVQNGVLQFGVVYAPARKELFAGCIGTTATLNDVALAMRDHESVKEGLVAAGYSPRVKPVHFVPALERLLDAGGMFYRDGSGALNLCYLAAGRLIGFFEHHINSWDCLGALAVIQAAGGVHSDFLENDGLWKGNYLLAGSRSLLPELARILGAELRRDALLKA